MDMVICRERRKVIISFLTHLCVFSLLLVRSSSTSIDSITPTQPLKDGQTLVSGGLDYELGFFSPGNSKNRYVGIWYKNISVQTVVWVANRENPLLDSSGVFAIDDTGNLVVLDGGRNGTTLWSSNYSILSSEKLSAVLLDSGNLVLRDENLGDVLWESFDYPSDTFLRTMKIGFNTKTGKRWSLTSWKSPEDPSPGSFTFSLEPLELPEIFLRNGSIPLWRSGQWNGRTFLGMPEIYEEAHMESPMLIQEKDLQIIHYSNMEDYTRVVVDWSGKLRKMVWSGERKEWGVKDSECTDPCNVYGLCGAFGICSDLNPTCSCVRGFKPRSMEEWREGNWRGGCVRRAPLHCEKKGGDGFWKVSKVKVPDSVDWLQNIDDAESCRQVCESNCSCSGYSYVRGIGCMAWKGELMDIRDFSSAGEDLYVRVAYSELRYIKHIHITVAVVFSALTVSGFLACIFYWRMLNIHGEKKKRIDQHTHVYLGTTVDAPGEYLNSSSSALRDGSRQGKGHDLHLFDLSKISDATNNFSAANKLGEGGFGPVYKGELEEGQEVAVKRLSRRSMQGVEEFRNELTLISELQHVNLVRLFGCCIEAQEMMLVYEYMANRSLASFLFDPTKRAHLDWAARFKIVEGIARGLLYLHRDSRLRIVHLDLKASNILLDEEMNPKISDFGMARAFSRNQHFASTKRVSGTYGYMAPEYLMDGWFSEKSDVFSFGVLLLEIVTGRRNLCFDYEDKHIDLLEYAWQMWNEKEGSKVMDPALFDTCCPVEALRCIHIGLLCVQENAAERPDMSKVDLMLESSSELLPTPKPPRFNLDQMKRQTSQTSFDSNGVYSTNGCTITTLVGR